MCLLMRPLSLISRQRVTFFSGTQRCTPDFLNCHGDGFTRCSQEARQAQLFLGSEAAGPGCPTAPCASFPAPPWFSLLLLSGLLWSLSFRKNPPSSGKGLAKLHSRCCYLTFGKFSSAYSRCQSSLPDANGSLLTRTWAANIWIHHQHNTEIHIYFQFDILNELVQRKSVS